MTGYLGLAGAFALVLGLLLLLAWGVRRLGGATLQGGRSIRILERVQLTPRQGLALVRVGQRCVLLSHGEGGVRQVLELEPEEAAALESERQTRRPVESNLTERLLRAGGRAGLVALLFVLAGPLPARAQAPAEPTPAEAATPLPAAEATAPVDSAAAGEVRTGRGLLDALPEMDLRVGGEADEDALRLNGTVGTVVVIGLLTVLPSILLLTTAFTRILVVLHFLRMALGTQTSPPGPLVGALALLLTGYVMAPTLGTINETAFEPWLEGAIDQGEMLAAATGPIRQFMLTEVGEKELATFIDLHDSPAPSTLDEIPNVVLISAFATSELRTAFQIGFALFLPFIVIDLVVSAILMSLGMFMLPPAMVSLPFKLLLFVLVDGWSLVVQGLVQSFG